MRGQAADVGFVPGADVAAEDVQTAIEEVAGNVQKVTTKEHASALDAKSRRDATAQRLTRQADEQVATRQSQVLINRMWEETQRLIAVSVVFVALGMSVLIVTVNAVFFPPYETGPALIFLVGAANLVVGFYFGRTNHTKTGGIGDRQDDIHR